jgi:hypothetical protein
MNINSDLLRLLNSYNKYKKNIIDISELDSDMCVLLQSIKGIVPNDVYTILLKAEAGVDSIIYTVEDIEQKTEVNNIFDELLPKLKELGILLKTDNLDS